MRESRSLSNYGFIVNMLNACIGIGLLVKPYALEIAGWYASISVLLAFTMIVYSSFLMAKVTIKAYRISSGISQPYDLVPITSATEFSNTEDESSDQIGMQISQTVETKEEKSVFQRLGYASLGKFGEYYANVATLSVLSMLSINILITEWQLLSGIIEYFVSSMPFYLNEDFIFLYVFIGTLPIVSVSNWSKLTFIGGISVISIIALVITISFVLGVSVSTFENGRVPSHYFETKSFNNFIQYDTKNAAQYAMNRMHVWQRILFSFLAFKSGVSGATAVPVLIVGLIDKRPSNIFGVITISYVVVTLFSVSFGVIGAVIYGPSVSVLILNNLFIWPSGVYVIVVCIIKCINLWASYAIFVSIVCDLLNGIMGIEQQITTKIRIVRTFVCCFMASVAYLSRYNLAFMTAILGTVSAFGETLVLPLILYIGMFYHQMSLISKIFHISLTLIGFCVGILVLYGTAKGLLV
eukprot:253939_1